MVSMTEKVRIKSIAELCRVVVVEAREKDGERDDNGDGDGDVSGGVTDDVDDDDDMVDPIDSEQFGERVGRWEIEAGRVYEKTIQLLGDELGKQGEFEGGFDAGGGC